MKIAAGSLNSRVTIESPTMTQDAAGQPIPAWGTLATVWANIRHLNGAESIKANAESSLVKASIRIRRGPAVDASCRVVHHGGETYRVRAVLPDDAERDKVHIVAEVVHG
jgi:SPP1 family predicted phage head-tail adaptor